MGWRFFQRSKEPFHFAPDVFRLHARLLAAGETRPIPHAGYTFFVLPEKRSIFVWTLQDYPGADDYGRFTLPGLAQDEERCLIYFAKPGPDGACVLAQHLEVIVRRGAPVSATLERHKDERYLALRGVVKVVDFVARGEGDAACDVPHTYAVSLSTLALRTAPDGLQTPLAALMEAGGEAVEIQEILRKEPPQPPP
jgi:hypothetical protein